MEEKKYKEALERAKSAIKECGDNIGRIKMIESIFSDELWESEEEQTRKQLLDFVHRNALASYSDRDKWVAYLEKVKDFDKQLEQAYKNSDEVQYKRGYGKGYVDGMVAAKKKKLEKQGKPEDMGEVSDGYHTFNELYYYRMLYNAAFFNRLPKDWVHKSKRHHDGEECFGGGWFIVMANLPTGQISNHYELKDWDLFKIPEKDIADEWDGHTPQQAAERLHKFLLEKQGEQSITISVDKMVDEFEDFKVISCGRIPSFMEIDAYRKGVNDVLSKVLIKKEKPITIGSKKAEGKLGEMIAASKEPAESGEEDKQLSHKEVTKKSDKVVWSEEDEENYRNATTIISRQKLNAYTIEIMNDCSRCIDWLSSIKERMR